MYEIETERLIGLSDLAIENGLLTCQPQTDNVINLLELKPSTGRESAFLFYEKKKKKALVCHIGITWKRGRTEVSYGTENDFRRLGYMQEALIGLLNWIIDNTEEDKIWGLPNGAESQHILEKCGFVYYGKDEAAPTRDWFLFSIDR